MTSSSLVAKRAGLPPTLSCEPSSAAELSEELEEEVLQVLDWAGLILDDWQESFLFDALRTGYDGKWAAFEVAGVVPRQNGKGGIEEARQLVGLFVLGERLQIHTAHEFKTCSEHFQRVRGLIEGSPKLRRQVKIIRTANGEQAIELRSGERLRFLARSRSAIRGFSVDAVYFDEAFELPVETVGNVIPALSARPNPQVWYFSSAPHFDSKHLHGLLERAERAEPDDKLFLRAWENDPDTRPDDVEAWRRVNPALGVRIDEDFVRSEMRTLCSTPEGVGEFSRERLGVREGGDGEAGIVSIALWDKLVVVEPSVSGVTYGLAVAPSGSWSSVGSAGRLPDGNLYVDNVEFRPGTKWVLEYLTTDLYPKKKLPIRIDPSDSAGAFIRPLREAGVEVVEVGGREYQQACGELLSLVEGGKIRHLGQGSLNKAVAAAGRRDVGKEGGWVWVRPGTVDISPLKAATLALSGVEAKRAPKIHVWKGAN